MNPFSVHVLLLNDLFRHNSSDVFFCLEVVFLGFTAVLFDFLNTSSQSEQRPLTALLKTIIPLEKLVVYPEILVTAGVQGRVTVKYLRKQMKCRR